MSYKEITQAVLIELLEYNEITGLFVWKPRASHWFASPDAAKLWNARFANRPAFTCLNPKGYAHGTILGKTVKAHRVAWCIKTGQWPLNGIDHRNRVKSDNRFANLQDANQAENTKNISLSVRNTSGTNGVRKLKSGKWKARIGSGGCIDLGVFASFEDAREARRAANIQFGYSSTHGESR